MPWVKGSEKQKARWVDMKTFMQETGYKTTKAYELINLPEFEKAVRKKYKPIMVNMTLANEILDS